MDQETFIIAAYSITAALLTLLCIGTWLNARRIRKQLDGHTPS